MDGSEGQMVRYSYVTPEYIMGSWMLDPDVQYAAINTQNRWQGVIFATDMNARVFPQCEGLANGKTYNQQVAVQHKNVMIGVLSVGLREMIRFAWYLPLWPAYFA